MKKILLLILTTLSLNCNQKPSNEELAISKVKELLLDSNSFELIKVEKDTIFLSNILSRKSHALRERYEQYMETAQHNLNIAHSLRHKPKSALMYMDEALVARDSSEAFDLRIQKTNSKHTTIRGTTNDTIINFIYMVRCYATARNGNKVISDYNVKFDDANNFIDITDANE